MVLGERLAPFATVLLEAVSDLAVALTNLMEEFPTLSSVILGTIAAITLLTTTIGLGLAVVGRLGKGLTLLKGLLEAAAVAFGVTSISAQRFDRSRGSLSPCTRCRGRRCDTKSF
ncbi:hypothetical protein [Vibrio phage J14]|nr:hypothetical protein [Vibrio phage J14]